MGGERVLIVGVSTRAFAESASAAGHPCTSVDAFGDLDQKQRVTTNVALSRDLGRPYSAAAAVAVARRFDAEWVAYVGNLENHPAAVRRLAHGRRLLGNSPETLRRARDPRELARVVAAAGGRTPRTLPPGAPLPDSGSWLVKPMRGGGGSGVRDLTRGGRVGRDQLVQERIAGQLASMSFAADGRRAVGLGLAQGLCGDPALGARGYRYCGSLYPFAADARVVARLDAIAQAATQAYGLVGVNGLDFILSDGDVFVLELNPRYSASMELVERATRLSIFETHAAACAGTLPSRAVDPPQEVFGKAILWARHDLLARETTAFLGREDVRDIPFPGERIRRGHPICTVFARGPDRATCYARLVAVAAAVEKEARARIPPGRV